MNILAALTQAEAKLKKQADKVRQQLDAVRAADWESKKGTVGKV